MARMIDGDRLLKMMAHWKPYMDMDKVRKAVKNMPTLTPPNEWISVKERLPEQNEKVLCRYGFEREGKRSGYMTTGCLDYYATDEVPHFQHASTGLYVAHWMPLPEPPEEER